MPCRYLAKILLRGKLAIRNIDEIDSLQKLLQRFVICRMEAVIGLVSIVNLVRDRHRTIARDGQPQDQLLQVWPMVLIFPVGKRVTPGRSIPDTSRRKVTVVVSW